MDWIKEYFETSVQDITTINLQIRYLNSSSSKLIFDFFDILEQYNEQYTIKINWIYEEDDDSSLEVGEEYQEDYEDLDISLIVKK